MSRQDVYIDIPLECHMSQLSIVVILRHYHHWIQQILSIATISLEILIRMENILYIQLK